jgi:hypothetical protein
MLGAGGTRSPGPKVLNRPLWRYVALFDVDSTVEKIFFVTVVLGAIGAAVAVQTRLR